MSRIEKLRHRTLRRLGYGDGYGDRPRRSNRAPYLESYRRGQEAFAADMAGAIADAGIEEQVLGSLARPLESEVR